MNAAVVMGVPGATGTARDFVFNGPAHRYLVQLAMEQAQGPSSGQVVTRSKGFFEVNATGHLPLVFAAVVALLQQRPPSLGDGDHSLFWRMAQPYNVKLMTTDPVPLEITLCEEEVLAAWKRRVLVEMSLSQVRLPAFPILDPDSYKSSVPRTLSHLSASLPVKLIEVVTKDVAGAAGPVAPSFMLDGVPATHPAPLRIVVASGVLDWLGFEDVHRAMHCRLPMPPLPLKGVPPDMREAYTPFVLYEMCPSGRVQQLFPVVPSVVPF